LPPGNKRIRVTKEGYASVEHVVRLGGDGTSATVNISMSVAP
jgi:hypothetical protein